ncbi:hypothetical protein H5410_053429 [Solanum commersonii]|uniref:Uncharacterized protein n=1 Tax=Solanum commersonii TaxID=4109 RepID=A0A9J5X4F3_SOLCO|nr:hypothetical protein H5410_053429 [Solanum commersonii]
MENNIFLQNAEWEPTLDWDKMPNEFDETDHHNKENKLFILHHNTNKIIWIPDFDEVKSK